MKRVLITGAGGFIGQHTIEPLMARGYEIHVATSSQARRFSSAMITAHSVDLLDCGEHKQLINQIRPTHLLHSAWYTANGQFWESVENVHWLKASISLVDEFYRAGGLRVLGLGTCAEYDWNFGLCVEDKTPESPLSLYGKVKKTTYDCLTALSKSQQREFAWARIFFPYGAGESEKRLIPHVITSLLRGETARCTHGNQIRDFLHVSDIGEALAAILDSEIIGAINVGSGNPVSIRDIVGEIASTLQREDLVQFGAISEPANSPKMILADMTKLKTNIDWIAKLSLHDGLAKTIDWWRTYTNLIMG